MAKVVPHAPMLDKARLFEKLSSYLVIGSTLLTIGSFFSEKYLGTNNDVSKWLVTINCLSIFFAFIFDAIFNYLFYEGSKVKRSDFIDNSLGSAFIDTKSEEYFTNDKIQPSIYKLAVNCFENIFFTSQVATKMIVNTWIWTIVVAAIFIGSAALGERQVILMLFQLSLPLLLFQNSIKLTLFSIRMSNLYENFLRLFNDLKGVQDIKVKEPEMIKLVIDYQTTLSWGSLLTNQKTFNKMNPELTKQWVEVKKRYGIPA
jgi:hypothetical protein